MLELITIKNEDDEYISELDHNQYPVFTNNVMKIMSFKTLKEAEEFSKEYLDNNESFKVINMKLNIKIDETILKRN